MQDQFTLDMPAGAKVLCVQIQHDQPQIWAVVTNSGDMETKTFRLAGTGHMIPDGLIYVGTFQMHEGDFIGHLFQEPS